MAGVLCAYGWTRISLAAVLVPDLSPAKTSGSGVSAARENNDQRGDEVQAGLGLRPGEVPHGSRVVVLSFLAADILDGRAPFHAAAAWHRTDDRVQHFGGGGCAWGRCFQFPDEARVDGWKSAEDDDAILRGGHAGVHAGRCGQERAIRCLAVWPSYRGPSGLDDQSLHFASRCFPLASRGQRQWIWSLSGRPRGRAIFGNYSRNGDSARWLRSGADGYELLLHRRVADHS